MLFWVRYKIIHRIEFRIRKRRRRRRSYLDSRKRKSKNSAFIMSREMQSFRIAVSQSIIENVTYSNVRANRRSFMFNIMLITNDSQQKDSIFIDILKNLIFWITNDSDRVLKMIQQIRNKVKKMNKKYNEQCDLIDEFQSERKILQKRIIILKNDKLNDKYIIRALKKKLKILEIVQNRIRNTRDFITSSFVSSSVNHIAEMTADINASKRFEKTKRSIVISNSTIFIENKAKFEHWLIVMQNKLKANENWYFIERMIMTYVSIKLNEKAYKHISTRLNKISARRYLIVNEMFEKLKKVYADSNKMQTTMNAFTWLIQINKYAKFHVFWNEFQRLMKEINLSKHFLLVELKRKMFYTLQNAMSSEFNIIDDIYELYRKQRYRSRIAESRDVTTVTWCD
jgi:hypothetical protein